MNYEQYDRLRKYEEVFDELSYTTEDPNLSMEACERISVMYGERRKSAREKLSKTCSDKLREEYFGKQLAQVQEILIVKMAQVEGMPSFTGGCFGGANPKYFERIGVASQIYENGCQKTAGEDTCEKCAAFAIPLCVKLNAIIG